MHLVQRQAGLSGQDAAPQHAHGAKPHPRPRGASARQLKTLKEWDKWREEAENRLLHEMEHGHSNPYWKLVDKRAVRQWTTEAAAVAVFKRKKIKADQYMVNVSSSISPAHRPRNSACSIKAETKPLANPVSSGRTIGFAE